MNEVTIYSTNLGAIIGGIIGGLVVLGAIAAKLLRGRSRENIRERAELDPEPKEITFDPGSVGDGSPHPSPQSSDTQITQLATGIPDPVSPVSSIPAAGITFFASLDINES
jgi:hypothetical protein